MLSRLLRAQVTPECPTTLKGKARACTPPDRNTRPSSSLSVCSGPWRVGWWGNSVSSVAGQRTLTTPEMWDPKADFDPTEGNLNNPTIDAAREFAAQYHNDFGRLHSSPSPLTTECGIKNGCLPVELNGNSEPNKLYQDPQAYLTNPGDGEAGPSRYSNLTNGNHSPTEQHTPRSHSGYGMNENIYLEHTHSQNTPTQNGAGHTPNNISNPFLGLVLEQLLHTPSRSSSNLSALRVRSVFPILVTSPTDSLPTAADLESTLAIAAALIKSLHTTADKMRDGLCQAFRESRALNATVETLNEALGETYIRQHELLREIEGLRRIAVTAVEQEVEQEAARKDAIKRNGRLCRWACWVSLLWPKRKHERERANKQSRYAAASVREDDMATTGGVYQESRRQERLRRVRASSELRQTAANSTAISRSREEHSDNAYMSRTSDVLVATQKVERQAREGTETLRLRIGEVVDGIKRCRDLETEWGNYLGL